MAAARSETGDGNKDLNHLVQIVMITKTINPIIDATGTARIVVGTRVEYRLFGLLIYRKTMFTPEKYGITEYEFNHRI